MTKDKKGTNGSNVPCMAGGCVWTKSDDDHGEYQRQHLTMFLYIKLSVFTNFVTPVLALN